ncbi:MAG: glutamate 5-kinase [Cytophagales bacterium]|nr:glutamate 5-kinase [Armatimonadota bacterium]
MQFRRIVVKVGTSTLTGGGESTLPDRVFINSLAAQIAEQRQRGRQVTLVTSGAIRAGMSGLKLTHRPRTIPEKQAAASVGQGVLMARYADVFANYGIAVGQVLLTRDDLRSRARYVNARNTFEALLAAGALPIVNENDTVATDEIKVGDNDTLAALVSSLLDADALLLLSDVAGLFDRDPTAFPDARLVERVAALNAETLAMAGGIGSAGGTGGMRTKLAAARIATSSGAAMWIAQGRRPGVISDCLDQVSGAGTYFAPAASTRPSARKRWLAWASGEPRGTVVVNLCARRVLEEEGRSLLPVGVVRAEGDFSPGDLVAVADETGAVFARGLTQYSRQSVASIAGCATTAVAGALGQAGGGSQTPVEVIHRDCLVLLP